MLAMDGCLHCVPGTALHQAYSLQLPAAGILTGILTMNGAPAVEVQPAGTVLCSHLCSCHSLADLVGRNLEACKHMQQLALIPE